MGASGEGGCISSRDADGVWMRTREVAVALSRAGMPATRHTVSRYVGEWMSAIAMGLGSTVPKVRVADGHERVIYEVEPGSLRRWIDHQLSKAGV